MSLGGRKIVKLPHGYAENGTVLDEVEVRAMTGVEEDVLSDDKLPMASRINEIIANCMERIGTVTDKTKFRPMLLKFSSEDQIALLVALRTISVGERYAIETGCPSCNIPIKVDLDLNTLNVTPAKVRGKAVEVSLPSGRKAKVRPMTIEDSLRTAEMRLAGDARMSTAILVRVVELDGKAPTLDDIRNLLYADRVYLRNFFDDMEGGIESEIKVTCPQCKRTFNEAVDIVHAEFFSPKMI